MEPVACQAPLENPAPPGQHSDVAAPLPACADRTRRGALQSQASSLYLKLLSMRVGLLGWYFCLKKIQWDLVRWVHISLELATDVFFTWVQNALLAFMMLLLLVWKVHSGAKQLGWRTLLRGLIAEVQHAWGRSHLKGCCSHLKSFVVWAIWAPTCCFTWIISCLAQVLEAIFMQAVTMAGEDKEEEATADAFSRSLSAVVLQHEEQDLSGIQ